MHEPAEVGGTRIGTAQEGAAPSGDPGDGGDDPGAPRTHRVSPTGVDSRDESRGRGLRAPAARVRLGVALALALVLLPAFRKAWRPPALPRSPALITRIMSSGPHGDDCASCHTQHSGDQAIAREHALVGPNDNTLCDDCHVTPWAGGSYGGTSLYDGSAHGASLSTVWPGPYPPARGADAARKCVNCHDPHGWEDRDGTIPFLAVAREEALCVSCHDGAHAGTDIRTDLGKPFAHPTSTSRERHAGPAEAQPADFAISPLNRRHAECADCHNPHVARHEDDPSLPPPEASKALLGVSRVVVLNGAAGVKPGYVFVPASDTTTTPVAEYQLCFKCHSSWTTQPTGQTDLARALNPNNPSHHAVEAPGANPGISASAFAPGWNARSMVRCGDCHGSESGGARGPHGSLYPAILSRPYATSPQPHATTPDELCFRCHEFSVYADRNAPEAAQSASRFNRPATEKGHWFHVAEKSVPCYACHDSHGSSTLPNLLVLGRNPGLVSYMQTPAGGTCTPTCHAPQSYTVNYAR
jgi:predicted CXXCH cytochrome family protein